MGLVVIASTHRQKQGAEGRFTRTRKPRLTVPVAEARGLQPIAHVVWAVRSAGVGRRAVQNTVDVQRDLGWRPVCSRDCLFSSCLRCSLFLRFPIAPPIPTRFRCKCPSLEAILTTSSPVFPPLHLPIPAQLELISSRRNWDHSFAAYSGLSAAHAALFAPPRAVCHPRRRCSLPRRAMRDRCSAALSARRGVLLPLPAHVEQSTSSTSRHRLPRFPARSRVPQAVSSSIQHHRVLPRPSLRRMPRRAPPPSRLTRTLIISRPDASPRHERRVPIGPVTCRPRAPRAPQCAALPTRPRSITRLPPPLRSVLFLNGSGALCICSSAMQFR